MGKADEILDIAQELIQTRGYNAFSFQDISHRLGIKKASVQFYYAKKADLGRAVVHRYSKTMATMLAALAEHHDLTAGEKFEAYLQPFRQVSEAGTLVCLCGVLGGEFTTLPEDVQHEVADFFRLHETWLCTLLKQGLEDGSFVFQTEVQSLANTVFSALQGGLLISRTHSDDGYFLQITVVLKQLLGAPG